MSEDRNEMTGIVEAQAQRLFAATVDRDRLDAADGGPIDRALWREVAEMGLPLALVSEADSGIGLAAQDAFHLIHLAAYHALPLPLGETMIAAALTGTPLEEPATLAVAAPDGRLPRVSFGGDAAQVLAASADGWRLHPASDFIAEEGRNLAGEPRPTLAPTIGAGPGMPVAVPNWLEDPAEGLRACGALLRAVQIGGTLRRIVEMSVQHATERQQFGRPIGKFQAIQHMLAVATEESAAVSAMANAAAESWGHPGFITRAALAKSRAGQAAGRVAAIAHQIHAAMGFTREHSLHFFTRRLWSWREEFGSDAAWDEWLGRAVCRAGGAALWPLIVATTETQRAGEQA